MIKVKFGEIIVGTHFALSEANFRIGPSDIKVKPACILPMDLENLDEYNVINMMTGEPRSFSDEEFVYIHSIL